MSKEEIRKYEECKAMGNWARIVDAVEKGDYLKKQSRLGSLLEGHLNAIVGAPPTIISNILLLWYFMPSDATDEYKAYFAVATWPIYFYLSVGRTWALRRIFVKYGLEPKDIIKKIKAWWNYDN